VNILIVEDEEDLRLLFEDFFTSRNHIVKTVAGKAEALKEIAEDWPEFYILDYKLLDGTGLEVLTKIRQINQFVPVVFMSGAIDEIKDVCLKDSYVLACLEKPFPLEVIEEVMEKNCRVC
jgi:DNA-binding response OmpR family regulator